MEATQVHSAGSGTNPEFDNFAALLATERSPVHRHQRSSSSSGQQHQIDGDRQMQTDSLGAHAQSSNNE
eukprot:1318251-Rhodomonas_salina.1